MVEAIFQPFPMIGERRAQVWRYGPIQRPFRRPRHFHAEPEINLVVSGHGVFGVGDQELRVSAGMTLLFQPGQDHVLIEESHDFELFVMALTPELAARVSGSRATPSGPIVELPHDELLTVSARLRASFELCDDTAIEHNLAELFGSVSTRPPSAHSIGRRVLSLVLGEPSLSGSVLAQRLRTTQSALSRSFHHDLGVTFAEFRSRLKLMQFVGLVDAGQSFNQAALGAEFSSYAQCQGVFQRVLGCSPAEYFGGARERIDAATFYTVLSSDGPTPSPRQR
jgi:AraC-like DNA-binding protein